MSRTRASRAIALALGVSLLCIVASLRAASTARAAIAPPPTPPPALSTITWQGVALGEPIGAVIKRLGEPHLRRKAIMGTYLLEYEALDGQATLSLTDANGAVTGIRLIASTEGALHPPVVDPFGVAIGDTSDRLSDLRGQPQRYDDEGSGEFTSYYGKASEVRWLYGLRDGSIVSIGVISAYRVVRASGVAVSVPTPTPSNAPTPPPPDASSIEHAIKVTPDQFAGDPQFTFSYVRSIACGKGDRYAPMHETIFNARRRNYSRIDAVCPSTGEQRAFYFDITNVFGRRDR